MKQKQELTHWNGAARSEEEVVESLKAVSGLYKSVLMLSRQSACPATPRTLSCVSIPGQRESEEKTLHIKT